MKGIAMGTQFRTVVFDGLILALLTTPFFPFVWNTHWQGMWERFTAPAVEAPMPAEIPTPDQFTPVFPTQAREKTILR